MQLHRIAWRKGKQRLSRKREEAEERHRVGDELRQILTGKLTMNELSNDDLEDAKVAVEAVFERYDSMKEALPEGSDERIDLQRSIGLKIEELRGRYTLLIESLINDE